nr:hybrid signal transduction histidine kinase M [Tanacetum cinerariifolium]
MLEDLSIDAYFCKIESIATILTSIGSPISNDDVVTIALEGLPDKYDNVFGIIVRLKPFPDLKVVIVPDVLTLLMKKLISLVSSLIKNGTQTPTASSSLNSYNMTPRQIMDLIQALLAKFGYSRKVSMGQSNSQGQSISHLSGPPGFAPQHPITVSFLEREEREELELSDRNDSEKWFCMYLKWTVRSKYSLVKGNFVSKFSSFVLRLSAREQLWILALHLVFTFPRKLRSLPGVLISSCVPNAFYNDCQNCYVKCFHD